MVKAHKHDVTHRILRYIKRLDPSIVSKQFDYTRLYGKEMLAFWLAFLDVIEKATIQILNQHGISGDLVVRFLTYAKKLVREGKITNFLSILQEYYNILDMIIKRNPQLQDYEIVLNEIEENVSIELGQYVHLWYGFYNLAWYDISTYF